MHVFLDFKRLIHRGRQQPNMVKLYQIESASGNDHDEIINH